MSFVEILKVIVLGIVEGFTEWIPISRPAHMLLVEEIIHMEVSEAFRALFMAVIQMGAALAVLILYYHKLNPFSYRKSDAQKRGTIRLWGKIIVACVPAAILGLFLGRIFKGMENGLVESITLIVYGVMFLFFENRREGGGYPIKRVTQISFQTSAVIGCFHALALIPGTSRSAAVILGAMLIGCSRGAAAEFSFFVGIPILMGSGLYNIFKFFIDGQSMKGAEVFYLILGMVIAFSISVYTIKFLAAYIKRHDYKFFGYYRIILGIIVLSYFGISALVV